MLLPAFEMVGVDPDIRVAHALAFDSAGTAL